MRCSIEKIDVAFAFHRNKIIFEILNCAINRISQYPRKFSVLAELTLFFSSTKWRSISIENMQTTQIRIKQDSHFLYY